MMRESMRRIILPRHRFTPLSGVGLLMIHPRFRETDLPDFGKELCGGLDIPVV
jgi:hypothetical protein